MVAHPPTLYSLLAKAHALLLDFDGPVCSVFAGVPAQAVAAELRQLIETHGQRVPAELSRAGPHELLSYAGVACRPSLTQMIEDRLQRCEVEAARTAIPTEGAAALMRSWHRSGRPLAIVSNNASPAVAAYLDRTDLSQYVDHIEGRHASDPRLMKPHPYLLVQACSRLAVEPRQTIFVGDSPSDLQAGRTLGIPVVAYAYNPRKERAFQQFAPSAVITRMTEMTSG